MIVDDVESIRRTLKLTLGHERYETETAGTRKGALMKAQRNIINLAPVEYGRGILSHQNIGLNGIKQLPNSLKYPHAPAVRESIWHNDLYEK